MEEKQNKPELDSLMLHGAYDPSNFLGSTMPPIFQTSAFAHQTAEELERIFANKAGGFAYSRIGNPTVNNFENRMIKAEHGMFATACSSGSAAIAMTLLTLLKSGDEIIASTGLYGGTIDLFRDLEAFGIRTVYTSDFSRAAMEQLVSDSTKAVLVETIGNPKLNIIDIRGLADTVHAFGIPLIVDNTVATPALVRPLELGADIVVHSSSKYINGNGSAISGVIVDGASFDFRSEKFRVLGDYQKYGKGAFTARLRNVIWRDIGACLSPVTAYANIAGLETLSLRMKRICENAKQLAVYLDACAHVSEVVYPGLRSHPDYKLVRKQFAEGMAGGILTIRVGSKKKAFSVINHLNYAWNVSNIGDTKTLVVHPSSTIFAHSSEEEKQAAGVYDDQIRISVGIEDIRDLIADFDQALSAEE
jgi:O-acetylhomoserine (thiol)-lyase